VLGGKAFSPSPDNLLWYEQQILNAANSGGQPTGVLGSTSSFLMSKFSWLFGKGKDRVWQEGLMADIKGSRFTTKGPLNTQPLTH
jgi:hypothetical protein